MRRILAILLPPLFACVTPSGTDSAAEPEPDSEPPPPTQVDLLLVIDTSGSMKEEASAVLLGADALVEAFGDADWQIGITTTSATISSGATSGLDPGEAGTLVGDTISMEAGGVDALREQLACATIYWKSSDLRSDADYEPDAGGCPLPDGDEVPREYLECLCPDGWSEREGSGNEEGLESVAAALCLRGGNVPGACDDEESASIEAEPEANAAFWREEALPRALILSDEGDGSRRVPSADSDPTVYVDLYADLNPEFRLYVLGPAYVDQDGSCLGGAQTWGVERYQEATGATHGEYESLTDIDADCTGTDVAASVVSLVADALR